MTTELVVPDLLPERIAPEMLDIADAYLRYGDIRVVSEQLSIGGDVIASVLEKREVQRYIDKVYMDTGYRNRSLLGSTLDSLIEHKLEEMKEAEIGSEKDISDLLMLAHKMRMEELGLQLKFIKEENAQKAVVNPGTVVNIQDNSIEGSNYGNLMNKLLSE